MAPVTKAVTDGGESADTADFAEEIEEEEDPDGD